MPIYQLHPDFVGFPERSEFEHDIVAVGGDLSVERLVEAYLCGVFPWYNNPGELHWYCPNERCVLAVDAVKISHSMRNTFNRNFFRYTMDTAFKDVMEACRSGEREGQTWIHDEVVEAYCKLHDIGMAHSLEVWKDDVLCGGLYGVSLGGIFFGESMFSREPNASKAGLIQLCRFLSQLEIHLVDCQVPNDHLTSLGAVNLKRDAFLDQLEVLLQQPMVKGPWDEAFSNWLSSV